MTDFERLAESINYLLDDIGVIETNRISADELRSLEVDGVSPMFGIICSDLLGKLCVYDSTVFHALPDSTVQEVYAAFAAREPSFSPQTVNNSTQPELLQYRILHFLCSHVQAERLLTRAGNGSQRLAAAGRRGRIVFQLDKICTDLQVEPEQEMPNEMDIIASIIEKVARTVQGVPRELLNNPPRAISATIGSAASPDKDVVLSPEQRSMLEEVEHAYHHDFLLRRRMLMTRLDVTIQSFLWGAQAQGKEGEIVAAIQAQRQHLSEEPTRHSINDALLAPVSLLHEHSKRVVDTSGKSLVKTVIIGSVPDRGGRANEMRPKKSDMSPWGSNGDGGRCGGGGGGGHNKGGHNKGGHNKGGHNKGGGQKGGQENKKKEK